MGAASLPWSAVVESLDRHDIPDGLPFVIDNDGSLNGCDRLNTYLLTAWRHAYNLLLDWTEQGGLLSLHTGYGRTNHLRGEANTCYMREHPLQSLDIDGPNYAEIVVHATAPAPSTVMTQIKEPVAPGTCPQPS